MGSLLGYPVAYMSINRAPMKNSDRRTPLKQRMSMRLKRDRQAPGIWLSVKLHLTNITDTTDTTNLSTTSRRVCVKTFLTDKSQPRSLHVTRVANLELTRTEYRMTHFSLNS